MIFTTLTAAALVLAPGASNAIPTWKADYAQALTTAAAQQKPVAVFIGKGDTGAAGVVADGQLSAQAGALLNASFVCVYVNTDTPEGKTLSGQFGVTQGLVISTKGGTLQALRHNGPVTGTDLTTYLSKYSSPTVAVTTTEQGGIVTTSAYTPAVGYPAMGGCPGGNCGAVRYYGYPAFTGGCANGQCGR
jgi:hypothetical protein